MNTPFAIAAGLSLAITLLHFFGGGAHVARPLLDAKDLPKGVREIQYLCWHVTTLALALLAILFGIAAVAPGEISLAIVATSLAAAIAALGIGAAPALKISYLTMPQGLFFVPITAAGFWGLAQ